MIVIFDLDYTLLDAKKFKIALAKALDISLEKFNNTYKENFVFKNGTNYNIKKHLKLLNKDKNQPVKNNLNNLFKKLDSFLYPHSEKLIKNFYTKGAKLILISFGNKSWQKKKISNLKIKKYFSKILIANDNKHKTLGFLKKSKENILIINDNAREILEMEKAIGKCEVCLINGPYSENIKYGLKVYNIKDCLKLYE